MDALSFLLAASGLASAYCATWVGDVVVARYAVIVDERTDERTGEGGREVAAEDYR